MPTLKISARRLSDYNGPRRTKPPVNQQKRELAAQLEIEKDLIDALMRDAALRAAFEAGAGVPEAPMSVWLDSDQSHRYSELSPKHLPRWDKLSEAMKLFIAHDLGMQFDAAFTFTANIEPALLARWSSQGSPIMPNIEQGLRRALKRQGISSIPFGYVVETRSKRGRSPSRPHLHGIVICENVVDATRFNTALELALLPSLTWAGRGRAIEVKRAYDKDCSTNGRWVGRGQWVSYVTKNAQRYDKNLGRRRVYLSQSLTRLARDAWAIRREE